MGYTHYWNRKDKAATDEQWRQVTTFAKALFKDQDGLLADGDGAEGTGPIVASGIEFNGIGPASHETFFIDRNDLGGRFAFCKTARKPYDAAVVALLSYMEGLGLIEFTSDGNNDDLEEGRRLCGTISEAIKASAQ